MVKEDLRRVFIVLLKSIFYSFQIENSGFFGKKWKILVPFGRKRMGKEGRKNEIIKYLCA